MPANAPTIAELARALRAGTTSAEAITEECLDQIAQRDGSINAFITVLADEARAAARDADRELKAGRDRGPLHGIALSIKDLIDMRGTRTTAASKIRQDHVAATDAPVIVRLREAGAILIGKTNLHEFALGTTNEETAFGPVHHPLDANRSPGGSSGGSAASVLAGMACGSIGTDTGGSIRIPAAVCGLVGLKPAYGDVSADGCVPLSTTLDHVGPLARSVADARMIYEVLGGPAKVGRYDAAGRLEAAGRPDGMRVGVLRGYFAAVLDPQVASAFDAACDRLRAAGVTIDDVEVPHASDIAPIYVHIALAEAAAYHAKTLESRADDYTPNVRLRLEMGRYILAEDYVRAMRGRDVLRGEVNAALAGRDALLLPSVPVPATRLGAATVKIGAVEEPVRNVTLRLTQLFNITGHPAITIPCGKTIEGLPIGAQLVGPERDTSALLDVAGALEPYFGPGTSR